MYELTFLINPISGGGVGKKVFHRLGEILDSFGMDRAAWTAAFTDPARLSEQTDAFLLNTRKLIAVGGDGTLAVVLDRVRHLQPEAAIGLIPLGTGNDLGRAMGIYRVYSTKGLIACLKQLLKAQSLPFDLWDVGGQATLVSYLSIGLDASVLHSFDQARKQGRLRGGALGNRLYYLYAFFSRYRYRLPKGTRVRIETPDGVEEFSLEGRRALLIANINSYAAGARPFPNSRFDDGMLEVAVFDSLWKYALITAGSRLLPSLSKSLLRHPARRVTLTLPPEIPVQLDGEDLTPHIAGKSELTLSYAARVQLLDLRRSFYALF